MKEIFIELIKQNYDEWEGRGSCLVAEELNKKIGEEYFSTTNPHFFTGDLDSEFVLVHLNPKRDKDPVDGRYQRFLPKDIDSAPEIGGFSTFSEYINYYTNFGQIKYGINSSRTHKSRFDFKQVRFIRPFNVIPLDNVDKFQDLENVIDRKLQLELIPFGSKDFNFRKIGIENITPFLEPILNLLTSKKRKYVIFCGRVFEDLLNNYVDQKRKITFKLTKNDGEETIDAFEIINLKLLVNGGYLISAIAPQFAKQGYPVGEYGEKIKSLYGTF
jgi:hypothetical protein